MKLIRIGQPVVTSMLACIDNKEIQWGYIVEADVETNKGVILHPIDVGSDGNPVRIAVNLEELIFIQPKLNG